MSGWLRWRRGTVGWSSSAGLNRVMIGMQLGMQRRGGRPTGCPGHRRIRAVKRVDERIAAFSWDCLSYGVAVSRHIRVEGEYGRWSCNLRELLLIPSRYS